jgi:3-oxoacyl-[acyl-carrier protein] reductase
MAMISADLTGRKALVTGAAAGIGLASVTLLARMGARVALNDLASNPKLELAVRNLTDAGQTVIAAPGDVGDPEDAGRMVRQAAADLGGLDYLVNNAGTPGTDRPISPADLERQDEAFWQRLLSINLIGPYRCTRAAAPFLKAAGGAVVNTASISAFGRGGSSSTYCATKGGLVTLTRELARGLAPEVRVNAIAPGMVADSDWQVQWGPGWDEKARTQVPLGRPGQPADYAEAILFLLAGGAYITGQTLIVDGGLTA